MATTIILKDWIKYGERGKPLKRQPLHPAKKLRAELRKQKISFTETVEIYKDVCLKIKGTAFFGYKTEMIVFKY